VNVSARQFQSPGLVADVARILGETGLPPASLKLEITESAVMRDAEGAISTLQALKALGVQVAIDDFGTGYSSLAYLKQFPVDTLKIDRSFVDGLGRDAQDGAIVRSVVALAKTLELSVTAEGIETPAQRAQLAMLGCDFGQGYLLGRPLAQESAQAYLAEHYRAAA
jgi:EAL domain-containing protein (putative c-di-GMP-specific phosphodiesterase class I)